MRYIIYIILIGALIGITFGLFSVWGWRGMVPDFVLLLVIALSVVFENYDYLFAAVLGGIWLDIVYGLPIGSFSIPLTVCGALSGFVLRRWLFAEVRWYHFLGAIAAATVLVKLWIWGYTNMLFIFNWHSFGISSKQIFGNLVFSILANAILGYPVYVIVEMFARSQLRWQKHRLKI